jgi:ornithine cyclodeaminase/alanine dehydrogenase-like protein (mu-crystallin family)
VRPIELIRIYSRTPQNRDAFAAAITQETGVNTVTVDSAEACVTDMDTVVLITKAAEPVIRSAWIRDGAHINAAGANAANRREVDAATIERASILVTDDKEQALIEAAEFRDLVAAGRLEWDAIKELGDLVCGAPARRSRNDVTLFKSLGVSLEDIAFADLIYRRALERGAGRTL